MVMALAAAFISANAQVKSISAATSALERAKADTENPKKADKPATWIKYGKALIDAYVSPSGDGWIGASQQDLQIILGNDKPSAVEQLTIAGSPMIKEVYETRNYYYDPNGLLSMIEITKPICPDALQLAVAAYEKAAELDGKCSKKKEIGEALKDIKNKIVTEAYTAYNLGNMAKASENFAAAATACRNEMAGGEVDYEMFYNAGFTAQAAGNEAKAKEYFTTCYDNGYFGEGGEIFAKLADIASGEGNEDKAREFLEEGFTKFPQSQGILIGLINFYMSKEGSTDRLFELLGEAKKNEPNNASLYYVEGNICEKLGKVEEGVAAYRQCLEIDPNYFYGYIGEGILYYNLALKYQEEAQNEMDNSKYMALEKKFVETLKLSEEPFEKAMTFLDNEPQLRQGVAEYLKNICFRFRTEGDYQAKYEKYSAIAAGN